jgi:hypothetical protein
MLSSQRRSDGGLGVSAVATRSAVNLSVSSPQGHLRHRRRIWGAMEAATSTRPITADALNAQAVGASMRQRTTVAMSMRELD